MKRVLAWVLRAKVRHHCRVHGHQPVPENRLTVRCARCGSWWG